VTSQVAIVEQWMRTRETSDFRIDPLEAIVTVIVIAFAQTHPRGGQLILPEKIWRGLRTMREELKMVVCQGICPLQEHHLTVDHPSIPTDSHFSIRRDQNL